MIKRLTREEMEDQHRKGLCFNCEEPFNRGHQCKKLFWIELTDDDGQGNDSTEDQFLEISLEAITSICNAQTMQLEEDWNGKQVLVSIDSGSTHSFVASHIVAQVQASMDRKDGLSIKVANREQVRSRGIFWGVSLKLEPNLITTDLFVLPLGGIDVVLGVNWLCTLGPTLWDFVRTQYVFHSTWAGNQITWASKPYPFSTSRIQPY